MQGGLLVSNNKGLLKVNDLGHVDKMPDPEADGPDEGEAQNGGGRLVATSRDLS